MGLVDTMTDDLRRYKEKKKAKIIAADLVNIIKIMNLSLKGLSFYSKYATIKETMAILKDSKTVLEIHLAKYNKLLEKENE